MSGEDCHSTDSAPLSKLQGRVIWLLESMHATQHVPLMHKRLYRVVVHVHTELHGCKSLLTVSTLQDAPFFTVKLNIKVLPCVIMFSTGVAVDRVAGFDDFGAKDDFTTDSGRIPYQGHVLLPA